MAVYRRAAGIPGGTFAAAPRQDDTPLLEIATRAAAAAGEELSRRWGAASVIRAKSSRTDFVTDADTASESLIRALLLAARPGDGIVGEELPPTPGSSGLTWIVDPLDGTLNFLHGRPQWSVSIAAEVGGLPRAGVVCAPALGVTYSAARGRGAWANGRRMRGPSADALSEAIVGTGFCYRRDARARQAAVLTRLLPWVADVRISGTASLDLCAAAEGTLDAYFEAGLAHYDYAAGVLIAAEAGLSVMVPAGGSDWVAVAPPSILAVVEDVVSSADPPRGAEWRIPTRKRGQRWTEVLRRQPRPA